MRIFELITILCTIIVLMIQLLSKRRDGRVFVLLMMGSLIYHVLVEGSRWQMYGVYLMDLILIAFAIKRLSVLSGGQPSRRQLSLKWPRVMGLILSILSVVLLILMPVSNMIEPAGSFKVGTTTFDLVDPDRLEIYGDDQDINRKIRVQMWYPTDDDYSGSISPWIEDGTIVPRGLLKVFGMPFFLMDHTKLVSSNSFVDAPISRQVDTLPIVVISHGWTGYRNLHSDLGEMFASLGYLAISIDHTYGSVGLTFEDGQAVSFDPEALPDRDSSEDFLEKASALVDTYAKDDQLVLDFLEALQAGTYDTYELMTDGMVFNDQVSFKGPARGLSVIESLQGKLNLDLIGVIGHSTGGGGLVKLAIGDQRIKAVIGLDPWVEPIGEALLESGFSQPALFFRSSQWAGGINDDYVKILALNENNDISIYEIAGSHHQDFSMLYQFGPMPELIGISGDLPGKESAAIQQDFIGQFMNMQLLGEQGDMNALAEDYDQVSQVVHQP